MPVKVETGEIIAFRKRFSDIADVLYEIRTFYSLVEPPGCCVSPFFRNRYFNNALHACINSAVVHVNDILALLAVGCSLDSFRYLMLSSSGMM